MSKIELFESYDSFLGKMVWYAIDVTRQTRIGYRSLGEGRKDLGSRGVLCDPYMVTIYPCFEDTVVVTNEEEWALAILTYS